MPLLTSKTADAELGLYCHIPFCLKKCFFCSYAVCVSQQHRIDEYLDCLKKESQRYARPCVSTVYVGGGTPSLLNTDQLCKLFDMIHHCFKVAVGAEVTLEINPDTMDQEKAEALMHCGVNRVSVGAQTSVDRYLQFLGRTHQHRQTKDCLDLLRKVGFSNISVDLMYGFPSQTKGQLRKDISEIIALGSEHVSLYALTLEPRSKFFLDRENKRWPNQQRMAVCYELVRTLIEKAGYLQYEISNFAKLGYVSRHNSLYWQGEDYIGLGMAAHSHLGGHRFWNVDRLPRYLELIKTTEFAQEGEEFLSPAMRLAEAIVFGLRMNGGVHVSALEKKYASSLSSEQEKQIAYLIRSKYLIMRRGRLQVTDQGRLILDEISARLM